MTAAVDRIRNQRHVTAMVALDNVDALADRVVNLLGHGRRMTLARRYTYVDSAPEVTAGLTVDGEPRRWSGNGQGLEVRLAPGLLSGFGFAAYPGEADTEAEVWRRFHAAESMSDDPFKRRRDMTYVEVNGGLPGDGPGRDDSLVIRAWNGDGVCSETVVAFDTDLLWSQMDADEEEGR